MALLLSVNQARQRREVFKNLSVKSTQDNLGRESRKTKEKPVSTPCDVGLQKIKGGQKEYIDAKEGNMSSEGVNPDLQKWLEGMEMRLKASMKESVKEAVDDLKKDLKEEMKKEIKRELKEDWKKEVTKYKLENEKVLSEFNSIKTDSTTATQEVATLRANLAICQTQLRETQGTLIRQDQVMQEMQGAIEEFREKVNKNVLRINGLIEEKNENCIEVVQTFFKERLKIEAVIVIKSAFRIGKGKTRTMLVKLKTATDKGTIFGHTKNLKEVTNTNGKPTRCQPRNMQGEGGKKWYLERMRNLLPLN